VKIITIFLAATIGSFASTGIVASDTKNNSNNGQNLSSTQAIPNLGDDASVSEDAAPKNTTKEFDSEYLSLVSKIQQNPDAVDFNEFRWTYTRTKFYRPYSGPEKGHRVLLREALVEKKWADCIAMAETILAYNYTSLSAHYGAMACHKNALKGDKETSHKTTLNKLLDAILATGDGKTKETAFVTISTGELRAFVELLGHDIVSREKIEEKDAVYDLINVKLRDTGKEAALYFNISRQWSVGQRDMGDLITPIKSSLRR
jgi:hypothetical protein